MSAPICFLDTETDGVHPGRKVWEVAAVRREPDGAESGLDFFVDIDLSTADPFGLRVGRFYDRHPLGRRLAMQSGAPPEAPGFSLNFVSRIAAARAIARITHGAHIVGAVPNFDTETLDPLLREHGLLPAWQYSLGDIKSLAVGYLAGQSKIVPPPWKSVELGEMLGVEPATADEVHTAMGDVRWVMRMYDAIMGGAQ